MKQITDHTISYRLTTETCLDPIESSKHIHTVNGEIFAYNENTDKDVSIGNFEATVVKISDSLDGEESAYSMIDQTQSICDVAHAIFDMDTFELKEEVDSILGETGLMGDFTIIESVEIKPEWRGANIGVSVIRDFIKNHLDMGMIVVLQPAPLSKDVAKETKAQVKKRCSKLSKHWKQLGFKKAPNSDYLILSTDICVPEVSIRS